MFDYAVKKAQRDRAAVAHPDGEYDYLHNEISRRLVDRLNDITSAKRFPLAVDIGSLAGDVRKALDETETASARGIETIRQFEISEKLLRRDEGKGHPKGVEVTYEPVDPEGAYYIMGELLSLQPFYYHLLFCCSHCMSSS